MKGFMITPELTRQIPHGIEAVIVGGLGWFVKYIGHSIRHEWRGIKEKLSLIEQTTRVQAENHLHTIQENTAKTNELLEKVVLNQVDMNGWLKGRASRGEHELG